MGPPFALFSSSYSLTQRTRLDHRNRVLACTTIVFIRERGATLIHKLATDTCFGLRPFESIFGSPVALNDIGELPLTFIVNDSLDGLTSLSHRWTIACFVLQASPQFSKRSHVC